MDIQEEVSISLKLWKQRMYASICEIFIAIFVPILFLNNQGGNSSAFLGLVFGNINPAAWGLAIPPALILLSSLLAMRKVTRKEFSSKKNIYLVKAGTGALILFVAPGLILQFIPGIGIPNYILIYPYSHLPLTAWLIYLSFEHPRLGARDFRISRQIPEKTHGARRVSPPPKSSPEPIDPQNRKYVLGMIKLEKKLDLSIVANLLQISEEQIRLFLYDLAAEGNITGHLEGNTFIVGSEVDQFIKAIDNQFTLWEHGVGKKE